MDNIDLNIDNYELDDILNLFQLSYDFTIDDLKRAKKVVKETHPDKSKLKPEFFIFFLKAYKIVYYLYEFKNRPENKETNYKCLAEQSKKKENEITINKFKNHENFNKVFNKLFESNKLKDEFVDNGYEEWFKSNENICKESVTSNREMNEYILKEKEKSRALAINKDFDGIDDSSNYELSRDAPTSYSAAIFSRLNYEDLKKAHKESLIPVTEKDYHEKKKYNSLTHIQQERSNQNISPLSLNQAKQFLADKKQITDTINTNRAYKLLKQAQEANNIQNNVIKQFNQLMN